MPQGGVLGRAAANAVRGNTPTMRSTLANTAILAGIRALGILTAPGVERGSFEGFAPNTASETDLWRLLAGTNRITPPLIWYGDKGLERVKNEGAILNMALETGAGALTGYLAGGGHFGGTVPDPPTAIIGLGEGAAFGAVNGLLGAFRTYSWKYFVGRVYAIGHGRLHAITEILDGERVVGTGGPTNVGGSLFIDDPEAYGGDHKEGGFVALADIIAGDVWPTQQPNPYLQSVLGNVPALSGKSAIVLRGPSGHPNSGYFFAGLQQAPPLKPFSITAQQFYDLLGVPEFHIIRVKDANPVEFLYDWLTARTRGYGYGCRVPIEGIDTDWFRMAAEVVFDEGLGYSADHNQVVGRWQMVEDLCSFIGCFLYEDPETGLVTGSLIRPDYDIDDLPVFDKTNIESVEDYAPGTYPDFPNEVRVNYIDRDSNFKERTYIAQNDATRRLTEDVISKIIDYPGAGCKETASILGSRELAASFPRPTLKLNTRKDGENIQIGQVIKWVYPKLRVQQMPLRVIGKKESDTHTNKVALTCSMDVYGSAHVVTAFPSDTFWQHEKFHFNFGNFNIPMIEIVGSIEVGIAHGFGNFAIPMVQIAGTIDVGDTGSILTEDGETITTEDGDILRQE